jgi:FAD/FMN-containing dehydrogenase
MLIYDILALVLGWLLSTFYKNSTERSTLATADLLRQKLSPQAEVARHGHTLQRQNADRYWGIQYGQAASIVVLPYTTEDVAMVVKTIAGTTLEQSMTFVGGAHSMNYASSSTGIVIDLSWMNKTSVMEKVVDDVDYTLVEYQGGATSGQVQDALSGSGFTAVTARTSSVGMGGFTTGGGIGYLGNILGFACDRVRAMEVVLPSGEIVFATAENRYGDLFWALHGGGGQFGIVTKFYQEAGLEPPSVTVGFHYVIESSAEESFTRTADFFANHNDKYSLMYYAWGFLPTDPSAVDTSTVAYEVKRIMVTITFANAEADLDKQIDHDTTFGPLLRNLDFAHSQTLQMPIADVTKMAEGFFPYGMRRGFWGPQTSNISAEFLQAIDNQFKVYIAQTQEARDQPSYSTYVLQYVSPGLGGHLPLRDSDTAWPHSVVGHQTLFDPGWLFKETDNIVYTANEAFNVLVYAQQQRSSEILSKTPNFLADYPNYMSPNVSGRRVFGDNIVRLCQIKQKYDPKCLLRSGRVLGSEGCLQHGVANLGDDLS